ncbi:MAG TPA: transposase [Chitinophagaceae bacterium]|jgi:transposase|nr:transposase [Chitinophagaceae bacterium]
MKVPFIIGADLSKRTVDFATVTGQHIRVENDVKGFEQLLLWLKVIKIDESLLIVMEHTGLYSYRLEEFLHHKGIAFTKVSGLAIKRSMGLIRGKNDKVDAGRIARYGLEKRDCLVVTQRGDAILKRLQLLHVTRDRLVKSRAALATAVKEYQQTMRLKSNDLVIQTQLRLIDSCNKQIKKLEEAIVLLIESEKAIHNNYQLLRSIKGVGKVLALAVIIKTGNFTLFSKARKFACFCGTAPFENTSGTSIRGKTRVSHLADKTMKTLLDLAAKSAIQHDKELKEYYIRKTTSGKPKMSVINVVRNKLIYRIFAVAKRQTPFINAA